jgi:hypothetical protein
MTDAQRIALEAAIATIILEYDPRGADMDEVRAFQRGSPNIRVFWREYDEDDAERMAKQIMELIY